MSKCLIVTGGGRGIGAATARLAVRSGWNVCLSVVRDGDAAAAQVDAIEAADIGQTQVSTVIESLDSEQAV